MKFDLRKTIILPINFRHIMLAKKKEKHQKNREQEKRNRS